MVAANKTMALKNANDGLESERAMELSAGIPIIPRSRHPQLMSKPRHQAWPVAKTKTEKRSSDQTSAGRMRYPVMRHAPHSSSNQGRTRTTMRANQFGNGRW